jgi:hypothetical protein
MNEKFCNGMQYLQFITITLLAFIVKLKNLIL